MKEIKLDKKELELLKEILNHLDDHGRWLISDEDGFNLEEFESLKDKIYNKK